MAKGSSGFVFGLTAAALAAVSFLAYQASATVPASFSKPQATASATASVSQAPSVDPNPAALPAGTGTGERVVYSVDAGRVWLVGAHDRVLRTFTVTPGSLAPFPGTYPVTSRSNSITGTDGTPIEHVVRFTAVDGVAIGFSAAVGVPRSGADTDVRTGGIRESRTDGDAMWQFATIGVPVVVIR
ncbi:hypothetical protein [Streptomyces griseorubiginosus]|uniref:hypothetical protein n=1 Tax=Streptomyces griseorubiginosus TaxID=67304 RepID=UPI001AD7BF03|nr:hypothetical protein [Streptomyces griseorubiginosus]MBO4254606.1 hypothetical protein [Streptomyces griseorubiginosus]